MHSYTKINLQCAPNVLVIWCYEECYYIIEEFQTWKSNKNKLILKLSRDKVQQKDIDLARKAKSAWCDQIKKYKHIWVSNKIVQPHANEVSKKKKRTRNKVLKSTNGRCTLSLNLYSDWNKDLNWAPLDAKLITMERDRERIDKQKWYSGKSLNLVWTVLVYK